MKYEIIGIKYVYATVEANSGEEALNLGDKGEYSDYDEGDARPEWQTAKQISNEI